MKQILPISMLIFFLLSCNLNKDRKLSEQELQDLAKAHNDSVTVIVDSLRKTSIFVPPLYDKDIFDSATTVKFFELAKATNGELKLLVNSRLISNEIIDIIKSYSADNADLLFLIDKTGSMNDDIQNIKEGLAQIIGSIQKYNNLRLGIALYGDKNWDGTQWFSFKNFESDYELAKKFIADIEVTAGGDYPESVYDGFFKACDQHFWKSESKRMIILIGDAPPLEKPLSNFTVSDIIKKASENKITMNFYPIVVTPVMEGLTAGNTEMTTYEKSTIISSVFPNPVAGILNIAFTKPDSYQIEIFNSAGTLVLTENFSGNLWKKDTGSFKNGAYVVRVIRKDKKFEANKFIVYR